MLIHCPHCDLDVLPATPGVCPQCAGRLPEDAREEDAREEEIDAAEYTSDESREYEDDDEELPAGPSLPEPNLFWALASTFFTVMLGGFISGVLTTLAVLFYPDIARDIDTLIVIGFASMSLAGAWIGVASMQPYTRERLALRRPRAVHMAIAVAIPILVQVLLAGVDYHWPGTAVFSAQQANPGAVDHWYLYLALAKQAWPLVLLIGCVMPAVAEEIFFRGWIGGGLVARHGAILGVVLTSALFGAVHLEPSHIAFAACFGLLLHPMFLCSQSLWPPMVMHFVNNAVAFGLMKLQQEQTIPVSTAGTIAIEWPLMAACTACLGALLWLMWRTRCDWRDEQGEFVARDYVSVEPPRERAATLASRPAGAGSWSLAAAGVVIACSAGGWNVQQYRGWFAAQPYLKLANEALQRGEDKTALEHFRAAAELAPDDANAWAGVSVTQGMLGQHDEALQSADKALQRSPGLGYALAARASALNGLQRYSDALPTARRANKLMPEQAWVLGILTEAAKGSEEYGEALDAAREGALLSPREAFFPRTLAEILATCDQSVYRDPDRALEQARIACEITKDRDGYCLLQLAQAYAAVGKFERAIETLRTAEPTFDPPMKLYMANSIRSFERSVPTVAALRELWQEPYVDDLAICPGEKRVLIIVPKDRVASLSSKPFIAPDFPDWKHEFITTAEFRRRSQSYAAELREVPGIKSEWCDLLAWYVGLTHADILATDAQQIADALGVDVDAAKGIQRAVAADLLR